MLSLAHTYVLSKQKSDQGTEGLGWAPVMWRYEFKELVTGDAYAGELLGIDMRFFLRSFSQPCSGETLGTINNESHPCYTNSVAIELYRPSDRRLSANLVPTFEDIQCRVINATELHGYILGFLDCSCYYFFQVTLQLYSRGWVEPVPDPPLLRKSGSAGNRIRGLWICSQELWPLDHRGGLWYTNKLTSTLCNE
jgi:hypothetical protein